jgi:xanthine dehydrogenase accessory factor
LASAVPTVLFSASAEEGPIARRIGVTTVRTDLLRLANELARRRESFVHATVVRREAPSSAQVGDAALITRDATVHGWLGGSCTHHTVVTEALRTLVDGKPKLIAITADGAPRADGIAVFPMTCHSGGSVEIFIEPVLPAPRLTVFGGSVVARALVRVGAASGYEVDAVEPGGDPAAFPGAACVITSLDAPELRPGTVAPGDRRFAVVATMGQYDEDALAAALALAPTYLGLVASRKRFAQLREGLLERGVSAMTLDRIRCPAGLDIGAHTPEEIAVSIVAEIVGDTSGRIARERPTAAATLPRAVRSPEPAIEFHDPVCGMTVTVGATTPAAELDGHTYYFCCGGCRGRFIKHPERYLAATPIGGTG